MRAVYSQELNEASNELLLKGDAAHHLLKVARVKQGENVLVLNGDGLKGFAIVESLSKREVKLNIEKFEKVEKVEKRESLNLLLGLPKKEAFEDILRASVELGIDKIYFWKSEYSQHSYKENERYQRILESGLIQSNNAFFPKLIHLDNETTWLDVVSNYEKSFYFCSHAVEPQSKEEYKLSKSSLYIIGPEGGLSEQEEAKLFELKNVLRIHLPTPILKAQTAVATAFGYLLGLSQ